MCSPDNSDIRLNGNFLKVLELIHIVMLLTNCVYLMSRGGSKEKPPRSLLGLWYILKLLKH